MSTEVSELKAALEAETDLDLAIEQAISGAVDVMSKGLDEIQSLLRQIAEASGSGDTDTVKSLTAVVQKRMSDMQASKAALENATTQLAGAVVDNTTVTLSPDHETSSSVNNPEHDNTMATEEDKEADEE